MSYNPTACVISAIVLYVLSCVFLFLRFYVRLFFLRNVSTDDYLAALATAAYTVLSISYFITVLQYGLGKQKSDISKEYHKAQLRAIWVGELFYFIATYLVKLSFAFTLFRIVTNRIQKYMLYLLIILGGVISVIAWFWALFFCRPVQFFWNRITSDDGSCKNVSTLNEVVLLHAAWALLSDLILGLVLPILLLWNSQMNRKMKASVYLLLGLGSIASIATIMRIIYIPRVAMGETSESHPIVFWSNVEVATGIISTAGATLKPLGVRLAILSNSQSADRENSYSMASSHNLSMQAQRSDQGQSKVPAPPVERAMLGSSMDEMLSAVENDTAVRMEYHMYHCP